MANPHIAWRVEFARQLAEQLKDYQGIKAVVVAGSVARGFADECSDLELPVFWDQLPSTATRLEIVDNLQGEFLFPYDGPAREDQLLIEGVQVDLWHVPIPHQEQIIEEVLAGKRSDLSSLNALDTIRSCIPILGKEIVQIWKDQAEEYPEGLAKRVIQDHLPAFGISELFLHAQRNNPTAFYAQLAHLQEKVFLVLLALNRTYFPTYKWLYQTLEQMELKPPNITKRFRMAFQIPRQEAVTDTQQVLEETLTLVEKTFPEIDTDRAHLKVSYSRDPLDPDHLLKHNG